MDLSTILILSSLMILAINWAYFFDWMGLIGMLTRLIYPKISIKEIEDNRKIIKSKEYKQHQRKWKRIFLAMPFIFCGVYLIWMLLIKHLVVSFFLTIVIVIYLYNILSKCEQREKVNVLQYIQKMGTTGHSSCPPEETNNFQE